MKNIVKIILGVSILTSVVLADNYALVIGCCENYKYLKNIRKLYGTENDAKSIYNLLVKTHKAVKSQNATLLLGKEATYNNITQSLKNIEQNGNLKVGDTLYMFYSGHGTSPFDNGYFGKRLITNKKIREWISNSTGLIPYDFNPNSLTHTMIITKRDFKPIFKKLDNRGIKIVWMVDACFAGNAYRSVSGEKSKFIKSKIEETEDFADNDDPKYKHLLFYSASLATLTTTEHTYNGIRRGDFTVELEKCLNKSYGSTYIKHKDLKKCLRENFTNTQIIHNFYPLNSSYNQVVIKAIRNNKVNEESKSYKDKLFSLSSNNPLLDISIKSISSNSSVIKTFCQNEILSVKLGKNRGKYIIALSQDINGRVIMLQPDKKNKLIGDELFKTKVVEPFGTDKLKVFTTNNRDVYKIALSFWNRPQGILSSTDIERLYKGLKSDNSMQTASLNIQTISKDVSTCIKGD